MARLQRWVRSSWKSGKFDYWISCVAMICASGLLAAAGVGIIEFSHEFLSGTVETACSVAGTILIPLAILILFFWPGLAPTVVGRFARWRYRRYINSIWGKDVSCDRARHEYATLPEGRMEECLNCSNPSHTLIMSMFATGIICPACRNDEMQAPGYAEAEQAHSEAVRKGNHNFS